MAHAAVTRADPQVPVSDVRTLSAIVEADTAPRAVQARVLSGFAVMALLLAGIGLHSLLAFGVTARTREIGVRLALGATRARVLGMVLQNGLVLVGAGVIAGGVASLWVGRALQSLLFGVGPNDQAVYAVTAVLCLVVGLAGTLLPALRASRVDPVEAMRN